MNNSDASKKIIIKKRIFGWTMIFLSAILYTIGIQMFIQLAGTFSTGLGALGQLFTFIIPELHSYFSIIYLMLNIPLIFIFWKKVKKIFIVKTLFFIVIQALLGAFFLISGSDKIIINLIHFNANGILGIRELGWPIIVLALIGAVFIGLSIAISWKYGGSTGGTDIIAYYYSTRKQKAVGSVLFVIGITMIVFSFSLTIAFVPESRKMWLLTLISTIVFIFLTAGIVNAIYPKYSKVQIEIHSDKILKIVEYLKNNSYKHAFLTITSKSAFTGKNKEVIKTVMLLLEVKSFIKNIKKIDEKAWISEIPIRRVFGQFNTQSVD